MKVYTKLIVNIDGVIVHEDSYDYTGPVAACKGGSPAPAPTTSTTTIDYGYNSRIARISEREQAIADEYFDFWRSDYKPMEREQLAANRELIPVQTQLEKEKLGLEAAKTQGQQTLLPGQVQLGLEQIGQKREELAAGSPVLSEYYKQALQGVDPDAEVSKARADVGISFAEADDEAARSAGRLGITGGRALEGLKATGLEKAKAQAGASTAARERADERNFGRLSQAAGTFKGGLG